MVPILPLLLQLLLVKLRACIYVYVSFSISLSLFETSLRLLLFFLSSTYVSVMCKRYRLWEPRHPTRWAYANSKRATKNRHQLSFRLSILSLSFGLIHSGKPIRFYFLIRINNGILKIHVFRVVT